MERGKEGRKLLKTVHFLQELEFFEVICHFPREKATHQKTRALLHYCFICTLTVLPGFPAVLPVVPVGASWTHQPCYRETHNKADRECS